MSRIIVHVDVFQRNELTTNLFHNSIFWLPSNKTKDTIENRAQRTQQTKASPSFTRRGYILKAATMENQVEGRGWWEVRRETGRLARRMDFSWTWKEKRKKEREELTCEGVRK